MLRKIGQLTAISLKFFFDLDYAFCHHALLMILLGVGLFKLFFTKIVDVLVDGWETVKYDIKLAKTTVAPYIERLKTSNTRDVLATALRKLSDRLATDNLGNRNADRSLIIKP